MKSSKHTQASGPNEIDYAGFARQVIFDELNCNCDCQSDIHTHIANNEKNANINKEQEVEMVCNCALKDIVYYPKSRLKQYYSSEQDINVLAGRCNSLPKFDSSECSQYSLDRKAAKRLQRKHTLVYERSNKILRRNASIVKRVQSPEIINIHRINNSAQNCLIKAYEHDKELAENYCGLRKGHSLCRSNNHRWVLTCKLNEKQTVYYVLKTGKR